MSPSPHIFRLFISATLALAAAPVEAGIVFTPHLAEYGILPSGSYAEHTVVYSKIDRVFDRDGSVRALAEGAVPRGSDIDASLLLFKYLWIGNIFEHTQVPYFNERKQIFRIIGSLGWQQANRDLPELSRVFGLTSGGSGVGDLFVLGGWYGKEQHWGPVKANGLYSFTTKFPTGSYDTRALLNTGTNYWTFIPQYSIHSEWWGRVFIDLTAAYQKNGRNDSPAYGGLTPTQPADLYNLEGNIAFKFSKNWFADLGYGFRKTVEPNTYDKVTLTFKDQPLPATTACNSTQNSLGVSVPPEQCSLTDQFFLRPKAGSYQDGGIEGHILTSSIYYVYRASSVVSLRAAFPLEGRGGQIDVPYEVFARRPNPNSVPISTLPPTRLSNVQEAGSVSASPFFELRFVYLFWAP